MSKVYFEIQGDPSLLCFTCPQPITLDSVRKQFPLKGTWHFRAKVPAPVTVPAVGQFVWEDVSGAGKLPTFEGRVHLKACPVTIPEFSFDTSTDLLEVKPPTLAEDSDGDDSFGQDKDGGFRDQRPRREDRPRRTSAEAASLKEATASISMFGKAFASSAKAAMEAVRKNVAS